MSRQKCLQLFEKGEKKNSTKLRELQLRATSHNDLALDKHVIYLHCFFFVFFNFFYNNFFYKNVEVEVNQNFKKVLRTFLRPYFSNLYIKSRQQM